MPTLVISGTSNIQDTFLRSDFGDTNYGANGSIIVGKSTGVRRELIRVVAAAIPRGIITGFRFVFYRYSDASQSAAGTLQIYSVKDAAAWVAGTANGANQVGSSCWNKLLYNTTDWPGSAGCGTSGTDYDAAPVATQAFAAYAAGPDAKLSIDLPISLAVSWRDGLRVANGLVIKEAAEAVNGSFFLGRSINAASNQPTFEVDYNPHPGGIRAKRKTYYRV